MKERYIRILLRLLFAVTVWGGLVYTIAVPLMRASPDRSCAWRGQMGHWLMTPFCYQQPNRCFHLSGVAMPLCIRCFGLLSGGLAATLGIFFWPAKDLCCRRISRVILKSTPGWAADCQRYFRHGYLTIDALAPPSPWFWLSSKHFVFVSRNSPPN